MLIQQGIQEVGGEHEDIRLIRPEWLIEVGRRAAGVGEKRRRLWSVVVDPIYDIQEGLNRGNYLDHPNDVKNFLKIDPVIAKKRVYVVHLNEPKASKDYLSFLQKYQLIPCRNGPAYLLGLAAQVQERDVPEALRERYVEGKTINRLKFIAAGEDNVFHLQHKNHDRWFLYIDRRGPFRILNLHWADDELDDSWALLAEEA